MVQTQFQIAVYLIDDDIQARSMLDIILKKNGIINYTIYSDPEVLLRDLHRGVQICVIDHELGNDVYDGLELMKEILKQNSYCKCIIMSGHEEPQLIKDFLNSGAFKYITKGERNFTENIVNYINEAIVLVSEAFSFYTTVLSHVKGATEELKEVVNG